MIHNVTTCHQVVVSPLSERIFFFFFTLWRHFTLHNERKDKTLLVTLTDLICPERFEIQVNRIGVSLSVKLDLQEFYRYLLFRLFSPFCL